MDYLLFSIPIYLRSSEEYKNEHQVNENKMKESWGGDYALGRKIEIKWPPWRYNDIIGYYEIIITPTPDPDGNINGVRVEKYITESKRIVRNPNQRKVKIWLNDPWFLKKLSVYNMHRSELKDTLLKVLDALYEDVTKEKRITKRFYIDVEYYKTLIKCLDFNKLQLALGQFGGNNTKFTKP